MFLATLAAYFCGTCGGQAPPIASIPTSTITDIIYAFGEPGDGNVCHAANAMQLKQFSELRALRAKHPTLHLLVSIGGWGGAPQYSDAALTSESRHAFAATCIDEFVVKNDFDGLDIDWEFPVHGGVPENPHRPVDRKNVVLLLREIRSQLDALGKQNHRHYYLTIATPAGTWQEGGAYSVSDSYDLHDVAHTVDWLNVMTYDMNNIFSPVSSFNAPLYEDPSDPTPAKERRLDNLAGAVGYFEAHGVPAGKIVLGMAFYGRGFTGVASANGGLYSKFKGIYDETPWSIVKAKMLSDPAWKRYWSDTAQAPWIYNARDHIFFSYDDPRSMAMKGNFVREQHLRGAMFWVYGEDDPEQSLLGTLSKAINGAR